MLLCEIRSSDQNKQKKNPISVQYCKHMFVYLQQFNNTFALLILLARRTNYYHAVFFQNK